MAARPHHSDLVQHRRSERGLPARRHRLVGVLETGSARGRRQSADSTGVLAGHVVDAVSKLKTRRTADGMVYTTEHIRRVVAGDKLAGRDGWPGISGRDQGGVDRRDVRGCDRDDALLVLLRPFDVAKPERPIRRHRPTERQPVLALRERILLGRERVPGVQALVAEEAIPASLKPVRARPGHDVDDAGGGPPEFRGRSRGDDLKLSDHFLGERRPRQVRGVVVGRKAINDECVAKVALTGH